MRLRSSPATGGPVSSSSSACAVPVASITMCNGARMAPCSQIRRRALLLRHPSCRGVSVTTRLAVHGWEVASPLPRTFIQDGRSRPEVCAAAFNAGDADSGGGDQGVTVEEVAALLAQARIVFLAEPKTPGLMQLIQALELRLMDERRAAKAGGAAVGGQAGAVAGAELEAKLKQVLDDMQVLKERDKEREMEIQRLQHLGTWTDTTYMKIGCNLANSSKIDTLFEDLLTNQLPPISPRDDACA